MLIIDQEFKKLIPALQPEEYAGLEKMIIDEGCRYPIVTWNGIIVDGHNRYEICTKHGIEYQTIEKSFNGREDVKIWMIDNANSQRNMTDGWKYELAQVKKAILAERGKEKQSTGVNQYTDRSLSNTDNDQKHNTRNEIAQDLGWSTGKTAQADYVWSHGGDDIKNNIKSGDVSINKAYTEIKNEEKKQERKAMIEETKKKIEAGEIEKPTGLFDVLVIDPPWNYGREYDPESSRVANPYPEMTQAQLLEMDIPSQENSVLFLWTTHAFIWDAKELLDKWGYTYKANMVWNKESIGMGAWLRMQCEFCLIGIKGKPFFHNTTHRDIITERRREHSRKPDSFYKMVEDITAGRRLDFFSREKRDGWYTFGAEDGKME